MRATLREIRVRIQARGRKQGAPGPRLVISALHAAF